MSKDFDELSRVVQGPMSLYIHVPFCKRKCNYCDFVSYAGKEELIDEYVEALIREFEILCSVFGVRCSTIYFGGGTPTLLEPRHFEKLLTALTRSPLTLPPLPVPRLRSGQEGEGSGVEISIEANPGTADKAKLKALHDLGINRLSIGVQSFNDKHLKTLGRIHNAKEALKFYEDARSVGFENINLDLIFALPNQTLDEWKSDLQTAINLGPNHLSTYNLQIESGTPLYLQLTTNNLQLPDEETELSMYEYTIETLINAGYRHYEISNFAKPGFECRHNINYWKNGNYIGIGTGAHSHVNGKRWSNPNCLEVYLGNRKACPERNRGVQPQVSSPSETLFLGLRLLEGLSTEKFIGFEKEVVELIKDGLLERNNGHYQLTRKGLYLGNLVFEKFV